MLHRELKREEQPRYIAFWAMLAFAAGAINAISFVALESFVSHLTGVGTLVGVSVIKENWTFPLEIMSIPVLFVLGVVFSALFVERPKVLGGRPRYGIVYGTIVVLLSLLALGGNWHIFGSFSKPDGSFVQDFELLVLICVVSGMLNGVVSSATGGSVRVTHITGTATDVGNILVRMISAKTSKVKSEEKVWLVMRLVKIAAFIGGAGLGTVIALQVGYLAYFLPAGLCAFCFIFEPVQRALSHLQALQSSPEHYLPHESPQKVSGD